MSKFVKSNGIRLHFLEFEGNAPRILFTHGLTANAHCFDGLLGAGLKDFSHFISVDLRGRGLSDKPDQGYTMADHAQDIVGLMDALDIQKIVLGGHSFGALLSLYMASHYPNRVDKLILIDAAAQMHPDTRELLKPTLGRLGQEVDSFEAYIEKVKGLPFLENAWDEAMLSFYQADLEALENGKYLPRPQAAHMGLAVEGALGEPWLDYIKGVSQPSILLNATGAYGAEGTPPLLPKELALETVNMMQNCQYFEIRGNHQTMLYGPGAQDIMAAINDFLAD
ncbi:MAG: alpha/beta hydrolase [Bacteroidota bacterium]